MAQLVVRIDARLLEELDQAVAEGEFESRSAAARLGIEHMIDEARRRRIEAQIVEGYRRVPETHEEIEWAREAARRIVEEEPW